MSRPSTKTSARITHWSDVKAIMLSKSSSVDEVEALGGGF
jgi:hypothetical protein